jgi:phosphoglycolate phosphatase
MSGVPAIGAVLFDLDGTLLDTAPDMVASLNTLLAEQAREPLPYPRARAHVSHGVLGLLKLAFGDLADEPRGRLQQRFLEIYSGRLAAETRPFDGMTAVLDTLEAAAIPWGVVTNKPAWLTEPLLGHMDLRARCACIVSGDTVARRKPDPLPLFHAVETLAVAASGATYVGDAERDIVAGRAAGMRTVAALYGYIPAEEDASTWGADHGIRSPGELLEVLGLNQ